MQQRYFDDIEMGDEFEEQQQPTLEQVQQYFELTAAPGGGEGDGRFNSEEGVRRSLGLDRPIVPGAMTFAIMSRVVTDWIGPQGRLHSLDISFRRPVQQGDALRISGLVTDTSDEDGPRVMLDVFMANERGERPLQGTAVVELPRRSA